MTPSDKASANTLPTTCVLSSPLHDVLQRILLMLRSSCVCHVRPCGRICLCMATLFSCSDWQNILRAYWMTVMNAVSKSPSHMQACMHTGMHAFDSIAIMQKTYARAHGYVCFIQMCALWQPKNLPWGTTSLQVHVSHAKKPHVSKKEHAKLCQGTFPHTSPNQHELPFALPPNIHPLPK
jgi:hypothetical protein